MRDVVSIFLASLMAMSASVGRADPAPPPNPLPWLRIASDLELAEKKFSAGPFVTGQLSLVRTSLRAFRPRVLRARDFSLSEMKADEILQRSGASVVINANFFDERKHPLGLLLQNGILVQKPHSRGRVLTGMLLLDRDGSPRIIHRQDFEPRNVEEGLQAGPRIIVGGEPTTLRQAETWNMSRRSGVCLTSAHQLILYVSEQLSMSALQRSLQEAGCQDALNLDGGSSSQLAISKDLPGGRSDWSGRDIVGEDSVPVFLSLIRVGREGPAR